MQLKIRRSQRPAVIGGRPVFILNVIADLTAEEGALLDRYKLWNEVVYVSGEAAGNMARAVGGNVGAIGGMLADKLSKKLLTIKSLTSGEQIECKDIGELIEMEEQIRGACANLKRYLAIAESFDGREEVLELDEAA